MRIKRPKTIYYYENKKLQKHRVTAGCFVEFVRETENYQRLRCRDCSGSIGQHDIYGFGLQEEAKRYEIEETSDLIASEQIWLQKLKTPVKTD